MKTFLVLGSSGQIGSALADRIKKNGDKVIEFDLVRSPEEDLRIHENSKLEQAVKDADFVFFLAFDVGGSRYLKTYQNTYDFVSNNIKIIDRTFDLIHKYRKPFIFASSQMANMSYSSYGLLKSIGEKVTEILGGVVVKFWNVYGLETDLEQNSRMSKIIFEHGSNAWFAESHALFHWIALLFYSTAFSAMTETIILRPSPESAEINDLCLNREGCLCPAV